MPPIFLVSGRRIARSREGRAGDHWRIEGPRLCVLNGDFSPDEQCYRIAVLADGRVQYYIDAPGQEAHGLLTKVTSVILQGPPPQR